METVSRVSTEDYFHLHSCQFQFCKVPEHILTYVRSTIDFSVR